MARFLVLLFAVAVVGAAALVASVFLGDGTPVLGPLFTQLVEPTGPVAPDDTRRQVFTVQPGASAAQIGDELQRRHLVRSSLAFRLVVDQKGVGNNLAAGDYELSPSMTTDEIVEVLAKGQVKRGIVVTIPEGWRAAQIADRLQSVGFADRDEFLQAVANPRSVPTSDQLPAMPPTLEGYLFPLQYEVKARVSGVEAADLMVQMFVKREGDVIRRGSPDVQLSPHQVLTLASIVEREAQQPAERPTIASVYLNRLARGMPLQADPTVQYAVASQDLTRAASYGYWLGSLTDQDLQVPSPFNTYVHTGLPPGPICNPSDASIQAVLQPQKTDYLYFVAKGDGTHLFANTLEEHNQNVAKVSRQGH